MTSVSNDFCIVILFSCTFSLTFFITVMCQNILYLIYFWLFSEVILLNVKIAVTILFNFKLKALQIMMYKYLHLNKICVMRATNVFHCHENNAKRAWFWLQDIISLFLLIFLGWNMTESCSSISFIDKEFLYRCCESLWFLFIIKPLKNPQGMLMKFHHYYYLELISNNQRY